MNRHLMHIYLIITLLCVFLGFEHGVKAQSHIDNQSPKSEHQIKQSDNCLNTIAEESQSPGEVAFRSTQSSQRVVSSRPTRLLPTHGGRPNNHFGSWASTKVFTPFNITLLQPYLKFYRLYAVVASPRLRYIIAQRRLLC